ncbi:MAG: SGNH/GDSL hydrolase family protein [Candidatus Hodarchaeales archaeon]|jgi:lysophospholipase L1-like esterase
MTNVKKILCIGNSHTAGFPQFDPHFGGLPESTYEFWLEVALLKEFPQFSIELDNEGICGEFATDIFRRLLAISNLNQYFCVLFWGGANDLGMGRKPELVWQTIEQAFQYCTSIQIQCFVLTIPPMNISGLQEHVLKLNNLIRKNLSSNVIDVYSSLEEEGRLKTQFGVGDGVHLSIQGYKTIAKVIFPTIAKFFPRHSQREN